MWRLWTWGYGSPKHGFNVSKAEPCLLSRERPKCGPVVLPLKDGHSVLCYSGKYIKKYLWCNKTFLKKWHFCSFSACSVLYSACIHFLHLFRLWRLLVYLGKRHFQFVTIWISFTVATNQCFRCSTYSLDVNRLSSI